MAPPLLSICIPTYNRCQSLKIVLDNYIHNSEFDDEVELIVSDNCSNDETQQIVETLSNQYPNIKYYRNSENIRDFNFRKVLDYGTGEYLKLHNDWCYIDTDGLKFVKQCIRENLSSKTAIFFTSNWVFTDIKNPVIYCNSVDEYMQAISSYVTSNNVFGVWHDDWKRIVDKSKYSSLQLQQLDWSYQLVAMHHGICTIYDTPIFRFAPDTRSHSGYNWFQVHIDNYYKILQPYVEAGLISPDTLKKDKRYVLQHFTRELRKAFHLTFRRGWNFDTSHTMSILFKHYKSDWYFYYFMLTLPLQKFIQRRHHRW